MVSLASLRKNIWAGNHASSSSSSSSSSSRGVAPMCIDPPAGIVVYSEWEHPRLPSRPQPLPYLRTRVGHDMEVTLPQLNNMLEIQEWYTNHNFDDEQKCCQPEHTSCQLNAPVQLKRVMFAESFQLAYVCAFGFSPKKPNIETWERWFAQQVAMLRRALKDRKDQSFASLYSDFACLLKGIQVLALPLPPARFRPHSVESKVAESLPPFHVQYGPVFSKYAYLPLNEYIHAPFERMLPWVKTRSAFLTRGIAIGPSIVPRFNTFGQIVSFRFVMHEFIISSFRTLFGATSDFYDRASTTGRKILMNTVRLRNTEAFRFSRTISSRIMLSSQAAVNAGIPPPCIIDMHDQLLQGHHLKAYQRYAFISFYTDFEQSHGGLRQFVNHYTRPSLAKSERGQKIITETVKDAWKRKTEAREEKDMKRPTCKTYMCKKDACGKALCTWNNSRTRDTLKNYLDRVKVVPTVEDMEDLGRLLADTNIHDRGICARLQKITHPNAKPDARGIYSPYSYSAQG